MLFRLLLLKHRTHLIMIATNQGIICMMNSKEGFALLAYQADKYQGIGVVIEPVELASKPSLLVAVTMTSKVCPQSAGLSI